MRKIVFICGVIAIALGTHGAAARPNDEAAIRALEQRFADAVNANSLDAIMACYVPGDSLFVFDVIPPRQYVGAKAYREDWANFLGGFNGPIKLEISDLSITADGTLGFGHSIQRVVGTDRNGKRVEIIVRVTDGYRKVNGKWLVAHEHVSVPVDLESGKADMMSKP